MARSPALQHMRYVLINRLAAPLSAFALLVIIGRHSDALLGEYALVMTYYYVMQMMPLLGLTPYLAREVARRPEMAGKFFSSIGLISMVGCIGINLLTYAVLKTVNYAPQILSAIGVCDILIFPGILLFIAEVMFMSLHRARPAALIAVAESVVRVALSVLALMLETGVVGLLWIFFATRLAALAVYLVCLKATAIVPELELPDRGVLREVVHVLPAFLGGAVLFVALSRMDFLMLSIFEPVEAIGYYAIGYRPFEISIILLTALIMALFPWISRRFAGARIHFRVAVKGLVLLFTSGLAFASIVGVLLADTYVALLFRNQHPHPVMLTQLFMAALVVAGLDYVTSSLLHASNRQAADTQAMAVGGTINLALLYWLIPHYGIYGALFAKLGATLVQCVHKLYMLDRAIGPMWRPGELRRLAVAIIAMETLALATLNMPLPVRVAMIALTAVLLPCSLLALDVIQPLRLLRFYWRPRGAEDVASFADLVDVLVTDSRRRSRVQTQSGGQVFNSRVGVDRASVGIMFARSARHFSLAGRVQVAWALMQFARFALGVWADPRCRIGRGWIAASGSTLRINACVGPGLVCLGNAWVGPVPGQRSDLIVGDNVTLAAGVSLADQASIASVRTTAERTS